MLLFVGIILFSFVLCCFRWSFIYDQFLNQNLQKRGINNLVSNQSLLRIGHRDRVEIMWHVFLHIWPKGFWKIPFGAWFRAIFRFATSTMIYMFFDISDRNWSYVFLCYLACCSWYVWFYIMEFFSCRWLPCVCHYCIWFAIVDSVNVVLVCCSLTCHLCSSV